MIDPSALGTEDALRYSKSHLPKEQEDMPRLPSEIPPDELEANFQAWVDQWPVDRRVEPSPEVIEHAAKIFSTHTLRFAVKPSGAPKEIYPFESIFLADEPSERALLSDTVRRGRSSTGSLDTGPSRDPISRNARSVGLADYVFSYLSIHDPHYARESDAPGHPIGIFIQSNLEVFPDCIATRRDLASNDGVDSANLAREFLDPRRARDLMAQQVAKDPSHHGEFWHYYGSPSYWDADYGESAWKKRFELHFHEKVHTSSFKAVLWPVWQSGYSFLNGVSWDDISINGLRRVKQKHPGCKFIKYTLDDIDPEMSFVSASFYAIYHFMLYGDFRDTAEECKKHIEENPRHQIVFRTFLKH